MISFMDLIFERLVFALTLAALIGGPFLIGYLLGRTERMIHDLADLEADLEELEEAEEAEET